MPKYVKKPIIIVEADQYHPGLEDGWEYEDRIPFLITDGMFAVSKVDGVRLYPYIYTLTGQQFISEHDWIIKGVKGERYTCKDEIFRATYDPIDS